MRITYRLVAAICLSVLVVVAAFALPQIREERQAPDVRDLERRASMLGEGLKEALEPAHGARARRSRTERLVNKGSARPNQGHRRSTTVLANPAGGRPGAGPGTALFMVPEVTEALDTASRSAGASRSAPGAGAPTSMSTPPPRAPLGGGANSSSTPPHLQAAEWGPVESSTRIRFVVLAVVVSAIAGRSWCGLGHLPPHGPHGRVDGRRSRPAGPLPPPPDHQPRVLRALGQRGDRTGPEPVQEPSRPPSGRGRAPSSPARRCGRRSGSSSSSTSGWAGRFRGLQPGAGEPRVVTGSMVVQTPASGLVTAMEPVLRACGGVWVAHGSGDADRDDVRRARARRLPSTSRATRSGGCG